MVQLPALNTPQFHWVRTSLSKHPQPVAPIYQPEVAARAIVWVSTNYRREVNVTPMTSAAILGDKIASGVLDYYLGWTGYESQQSGGPIESNRADNLWAPVESDLGAHGEFDDRAHARSLYWSWTKRRRWALPAFVSSAALLWRHRRRSIYSRD